MLQAFGSLSLSFPRRIAYFSVSFQSPRFFSSKSSLFLPRAPRKGYALPTDPCMPILFWALLFCWKSICFTFDLSISSSFNQFFITKAQRIPQNWWSLPLYSGKGRELGSPCQNLPHMLITLVPSHLLSIRPAKQCPQCVWVACAGSFPKHIPIQNQCFVENGDSHLPPINDSRKSNMIAPSLKGFTQLSWR